MKEYIFRRAEDRDIPFIARTILEAEKSGTGILTYTTLMGMEEEEAFEVLQRVLQKSEVGPCEVSLSSFFVVTTMSNEVAASCSMWVEGALELSSAQIKAIALREELTSKHLLRLVEHRARAASLTIPREDGSLQVGVVYTDSAHRGRGLAAKVIQFAIKELDPQGIVEKAEVQIFANNDSARRAYEKLGFEQVSKVSGEEALLAFFPSNEKILMQLSLKTKNNG